MKDQEASGRRLRALLVTYDCNPYHGSESAIGWNRAVELARHCDVWALCVEHECRDDVNRYVREHGAIPGLNIVFVGKRRWELALERMPGGYYPSYHLWHRRALRTARRLHKEIGFDLAHQVNLIGYREPGYLWKLPIPFVWGPVGGTQNYPARFLRAAGPRAAIGESVRTVINRLQLRFSPRVRRAARRAEVLFASNSTNQHDLAQSLGVAPVRLQDVGIHKVADRPRAQSDPDRELRILWTGLVVPRKALHLLVLALARLPRELPYQVRVLGDGSERRRCERLARRLGIDDKIDWRGWVPRSEALKHYEWADVHAFTSLRDTTGNVVLEALGAGVPVICLDHQGVGDVVTPKCGIKLPVTDADEVARRLAEAIAHLALHRDVVERLSAGAVERARDFLWSRQAEVIAAAYREITADATRQAGARPPRAAAPSTI